MVRCSDIYVYTRRHTHTYPAPPTSPASVGDAIPPPIDRLVGDVTPPIPPAGPAPLLEPAAPVVAAVVSTGGLGVVGVARALASHSVLFLVLCVVLDCVSCRFCISN